MTIKHAFTSGKADGADGSVVRPSNWNADHQVDATGIDTATAIPLKVGATNASAVQLGKAGVGVTAPGGVTADLTGNASGNAATATKLATARAINGQDFDGTGPITINAVDATAREPAIAAGTEAQYLRGDKTWQTTPTGFPGFGTTEGTACAGNDARLSDARAASGGTAANVSGTVAIGNGGTGQTTAQAALNALAGAVTADRFLRANGTNVVLNTIQATDVPTLNQDTSGTAAVATVARSADTAAAGALAIGPTNATSIVLGKDGVPVTHGVVWKDIPSPALQATTGTSGLTVEGYRDTGHLCLKMRHDQDDTISIEPEMDHGWVVNSEVRCHIHYTPHVTPATDQVVRLQYSYAWAHVDAEVPALSGWTTGTVDITIPASGAHTFQKKMYSIFASTPTGSGPASILLIKFTRLSSSASDTYTTTSASGTQAANFVLWAIGLHVQVHKAGTTTETA